MKQKSLMNITISREQYDAMLRHIRELERRCNALTAERDAANQLCAQKHWQLQKMTKLLGEARHALGVLSPLLLAAEPQAALGLMELSKNKK